MQESVPRVLIVDDHEVVTEALALALRLEGFEHVAVAADLSPEGVLEAAEKADADIRLILQKLGVNSHLAAIVLAHRAGWGADRP